MKTTKPIRFILYARKSTESEDRQILSIESQIDELVRVAKAEKLQIVRTLQESRSAKTLDRPVFAQMLEMIKRGEADGILCWKLDRLARNMVDGGQVINMLQMNVIRHVRTYERSYYPADNVLLLSVEFGMANQFSRDLAVNVTRGMKKKAEMGWYPSRPPLGYLNSKSSTRGSNTIYKDPERYDLVRKVWDLALAGLHSPKHIRRIATDEWGLRMRNGKRMSIGNIYVLLTNPFYYGTFNWPRGSDNWYDGKHEPMITQNEFDKVQVILGNKGKPRVRTHSFPFVGTMKCGECGMAVTAEEKRKVQKNGNIHEYIYYHCTKQSKTPCGQGSIEQKVLIEQVDTELASLEIPESFHLWATKWVKKEVEKESGTHGLIIESQRAEYDKICKKIEGLIDMRAGGEITETEFRSKKDAATKEKERLSELLGDADTRFNAWADNMETALSFVAQAREKFSKGSINERRSIFFALGSNLLLKDRKVIFDEAGSYLPMKKIALEIKKLGKRLEPQEKVAKQGRIEQLYERSSVVCALLDDIRTRFSMVSPFVLMPIKPQKEAPNNDKY